MTRHPDATDAPRALTRFAVYQAQPKEIKEEAEGKGGRVKWRAPNLREGRGLRLRALFVRCRKLLSAGLTPSARRDNPTQSCPEQQERGRFRHNLKLPPNLPAGEGRGVDVEIGQPGA